MRCISALVLAAGCGFSGSSTNTKPADARLPDGSITGDDATGSDDAAPPDAIGCTPGFIDVCAQADPSSGYDITTATNLNTDTDSHCIAITQGGKAICLIYATEVTIAATGSLTVTGGRSLAIVSTSTLNLDGAIDVASHGAQVGPAADDAGCTFATAPENDLGGGGGGAGGTFPGNGGNGGIGDNNNSLGQDGQGIGGTHGATLTAGTLHGGCRGQKGGDERPGGFTGGVGGHSGGALYLGARGAISITGSIRATGARGEGGQSQAGGGGGGTGGLVVIESPAISISGQISANGGSGAQGGGRIGLTNISGRPGNDGTLGTTPAAGGFGANNNDGRFATGGNGGAGTTDATKGGDSELGGGGGGGAVGVIKLIGTTQLGGSTISPPPS